MTHYTAEQPDRPRLHPRVDEWWQWTHVGFNRSPVPYWLSAVLIGFLAYGEQLLEYSLRDPTLSSLEPDNLLRMLAVPTVFVYCVIALHALKYGAVKRLNRLRRIVLIDDDAYHEHVRSIVCIPGRVEVLLLIGSTLFLFLVFVPLRLPTPTSGGVSQLPANPLQASVILVTYAALGWQFLMLLYTSVNLGRGLARLAREPLEINIFDPHDRLPFGQLSLLHSLTLVGLIVLLVVFLGRPGATLDYIVIGLLSFGSLCALVLPLRGVRQQVEQVKDDVLKKLEGEFQEIQDELMIDGNLDSETLTELSKRNEVLERLRTTVLRAPTWPFRNASASIRAAVVAASPILYFLLTELLRTLMAPLLGS